MDRGLPAHESIPQHQGQGPAGAGQLEVLGTSPPRAAAPICSEIAEGFRLQSLRPCDVTRLLNSTPLGPVISERQFYRHRARAGFRIGDRRRIDFFCYVAWLHSQRVALTSRRKKAVLSANLKGVPNVKSVLQLVANQQFRCALTGRALTPDLAALDHKMPVCRGGEHRIENAQVLHKDVNRAKGALTNEEFISLCREVVTYTSQPATQNDEGNAL